MVERAAKGWQELARILIFSIVVLSGMSGVLILLAHYFSTGLIAPGTLVGLVTGGTGVGMIRRRHNRLRPPVDQLSLSAEHRVAPESEWPADGAPVAEHTDSEANDIPVPPPRRGSEPANEPPDDPFGSLA
ncbi:hypothetical protein [Kitasatospora sp. MAP5-34]|uniref:hypothetical protein n=1 Tax=Kitasatospora sp. MAP5-34 TaxID=3035102 RepID=UPI002476B15E|nr:hypothetical protein [Kitasatospora sp. MAP5-34]